MGANPQPDRQEAGRVEVSAPDKYLAELPFFPGFYESMLSGAIDMAEERDAEYYAEKEIPIPRREPEDLQLSNDEEPREWQPEHLRISEEEFASIFFDCTDYQKCYLKVAQFWVEAFDWWCHKSLGTPKKSFALESVSSPREYNFTTDRVFAEVPAPVVEMLFERSAKEGHRALERRIKETCTSYDGFSSFYSNWLEEWLDKPLAEWDHNEIGALIAAAIGAHEEWAGGASRREERGEFQWALYGHVFSGNGKEDDARNVDWTKFEEKVAALRAEKLEQYNNQQGKELTK